MCLPDGKTRNSHFNELVGVEEADVRRQGKMWLSGHIHCFYNREPPNTLGGSPPQLVLIHQMLYHTPLGYLSRGKCEELRQSHER